MARPTRSASPAPDAAAWPKPLTLDSRGVPSLSDEQRESAVEIAERLLEIDPASRDCAWVRDQATYFFATRDPTDTEFDPETKAPRYRWEDIGEGVKVGWLAS